jgi:hypothetical protein
VIPIAKTKAIRKGYLRMSLIIDPDLHRAFKLATVDQGRQMSEVILEFIKDYVKKYAPQALPQKGGRK